jgi:hypothetical protein
LGPGVDGFVVGTHAKAVSALGEEMKLAGEVVLFVFQVEHGGGRRVLTVVVRTGEEHRRRIGRHAEALL